MSATVRVSKPVNWATPWSSWTTYSPTAKSPIVASRPRPGAGVAARRRWTRRRIGITASFSDGATKPSLSAASAKCTAGSELIARTSPDGLIIAGVIRSNE